MYNIFNVFPRALVGAIKTRGCAIHQSCLISALPYAVQEIEVGNGLISAKKKFLFGATANGILYKMI